MGIIFGFIGLVIGAVCAYVLSNSKLNKRVQQRLEEAESQAEAIKRDKLLEVKEKYNTLRSYEVGSSPEIIDIVNKYEEMSRFVCTHCGRPATCETQGYIASFCDDCCKNSLEHKNIKSLDYYKNLL